MFLFNRLLEKLLKKLPRFKMVRVSLHLDIKNIVIHIVIKIQINHDKSILIKRSTLVGNNPLLTSDIIDFLKVLTQKRLAGHFC